MVKRATRLLRVLLLLLGTISVGTLFISVVPLVQCKQCVGVGQLAIIENIVYSVRGVLERLQENPNLQDRDIGWTRCDRCTEDAKVTVFRNWLYDPKNVPLLEELEKLEPRVKSLRLVIPRCGNVTQ